MLSFEKAKKLGLASLIFNWITGIKAPYMKDDEFEKYINAYQKYIIEYKKTRLMEAL
ncbi:MAG: hypothetical protein QW795_03430 [Candidatus Bathyarchaeia archaeon]